METDGSFGWLVPVCRLQGERDGRMAVLRSSLRPCEAAEDVLATKSYERNCASFFLCRYIRIVKKKTE